MDGLKRLLNKIAVLTQSNEHNESRARIAEWYGFDNYKRFFRSLEDLEMNTTLMEARNAVTKEMFKKIEEIDGKEVADLIWKSF